MLLKIINKINTYYTYNMYIKNLIKKSILGIIITVILFSADKSKAKEVTVNEEVHNKKCISQDIGFRNNSQGRGWFWKEEACNELDDEEIDNISEATEKTSIIKDKTGREYSAIPLKQNIPWEIIDKISPKDIREIIEVEARDIAVTYPTYENIYEYNKLKKYITDKAYKFAAINSTIINSDPNLTSNLSNLNSSFTIREDAKKEFIAGDSEITKNIKNFAILYFKSEACPYCKKQTPILNELVKNYSINLIVIDIQEFRALAVALKTATIPDVFIVHSKNQKVIKDIKYQIQRKDLLRINNILLSNKDNLKFIRIATGLNTYSDLRSKLINALKYL